MGILCQNSTLCSWCKDSRTKTIDLEISLLHHGIFVMIPLSTLTEKSKLNVEYRSQLLFGFQINFSVSCAGHPLDNIPSSWIKENTTPRVTRQWCRTVPSLQLDQQDTKWSKMVETSTRTQHRRATSKIQNDRRWWRRQPEHNTGVLPAEYRMIEDGGDVNQNKT